MVVPTFSPSTMAAAMGKSIHPLEHMIRVSAMVAADDCTTTVSRIPMNTKRSTDHSP